MALRDVNDRGSLLDYLRTKTSRPVSFGEIAKALKYPRNEFRTLKRILSSLVNSGELYRTRSKLYGVAEEMNLVTGFFEAHRDGYGFVLPDTVGERDLFVPPRKTSGAMTGDRVIARVESPAKREARIIKILRRSQKRIVGKFSYGKNFYFVRPKGKKIPFDVYIPPREKGRARVGDMVVVELTSYPTCSRPPEGMVVKVVPEADSPAVEIDMVIENSSLSRKFPASVLKEAGGLQEKINAHGRTDCRELLTVTIDGEMAKDFDDAVSIRRTPHGFILWVHIADVSAYVTWGSAIDLEARDRATSVYFTDRVIPMLPERLSNDLCSLVPGSDRLAFTVEMQFDRNGHLGKKDFYPSIINSNERMTYTAVTRILADTGSREREKYGYLLGSLEAMRELHEVLRKQRVKRGSLDFDLPEPEVLLDIQGMPEAIIRAERNVSHMIIEEFMIAANEAVASYLEEEKIPCLYRVHEEPYADKIESLKKIFHALRLHMRGSSPRAFQRIFEDVRGTAEEYLVNMLLLRSLKQARYSTENIGHFGLASESYTHFTSPIRRYPDLVVHRILKDVLKKRRRSENWYDDLVKLLPEIAFHSSRMERVADEAEREVVDAMRVWFMKDKVGEEYAGIITDITTYGLKVQLLDFFVVGLLRVSSMTDDYYQFDEMRYRLTGRHTRRTFTLGETVHVRIERVDMEERAVMLAMA